MNKYLIILACAIAGVFIARYFIFNYSDIKGWELFWHFVLNIFEGGVFRAVFGEKDLVITIIKSGAFLKSLAGFLIGGACAWCVLMDVKTEENTK
ncbi:MAG: hypothetical protein ACRBEE_12355 [Arenicella sp.]